MQGCARRLLAADCSRHIHRGPADTGGSSPAPCACMSCCRDACMHACMYAGRAAGKRLWRRGHSVLGGGRPRRLAGGVLLLLLLLLAEPTCAAQAARTHEVICTRTARSMGGTDSRHLRCRCKGLCLSAFGRTPTACYLGRQVGIGQCLEGRNTRIMHRRPNRSHRGGDETGTHRTARGRGG